MSEELPDPVEPSAEELPRRPRRRRGRPSRARGQPNSSDDASARWTVRGVPPHVREMALKAASGRGMTVGDWLAEAIVGAVRTADKAAPGGSRLPAVEPPPDIGSVLQSLDDRLRRLEERPKRGFFGRLFGRRS